MSEARPRFPVGLTIATAIAFAILIGLGVWQLQRLKWKEALLAHVAELEMSKAQALEFPLAALARGADVEYTRVSIVCPGIASVGIGMNYVANQVTYTTVVRRGL